MMNLNDVMTKGSSREPTIENAIIFKDELNDYIPQNRLEELMRKDLLLYLEKTLNEIELVEEMKKNDFKNNNKRFL